MAKTSAIINSTDPVTGKTLQKSLTDINPDASNEVIAEFGQMLNSITGNGYVNTVRVDKINCDLEAGGGMKTPTITFEGGNTQVLANAATTDNEGRIKFTYDGDGVLYSRFVVPFKKQLSDSIIESFNTSAHIEVSSTGNEHRLKLGNNNFPLSSTEDVVIEIYATATDTCKAVTATLTLTV